MRLKHKDIRIVDDAFDMHGGYVLDFSDRTFAQFFDDEFGINIAADKYLANGTSKAKRLRTFLGVEDEYIVAKVLRALWAHKDSLPSKGTADVKTPLFDLINRIEGGGVMPRTDALEKFVKDETLEELIAAIERDVGANKPAAALDRLHTYCMKKTAHLIAKHGGTCDRDDPLHSRMGKYLKLLEQKRQLREISKRALKSAISIFESFNHVRNNESLAHDNDIIDQFESRYIFDSVTAILRFVKAIEEDKYGS